MAGKETEGTEGNEEVEAPVTSDFNLQEWGKSIGLLRKTTQYLSSEALTSKRVLLMLEKEEVFHLPLPLGQQKVLWAGLLELEGVRPPPAGTTSAEPVNQHGGDSGLTQNSGQPSATLTGQPAPGPVNPDTGLPPPVSHPGIGPGVTTTPLDSLLQPLTQALGYSLAPGSTGGAAGAQPLNYALAPGATGGVTVLPSGVTIGQPNPAYHLPPLLQQTGKPVLITDFVTPGVEEVELPVAGSGDSPPVLKAGPKKPRLENITQPQWFAANARILSGMMANRTPDLEVRSYLTYVTKTCELADRYEWSSVLLYDQEYRQQQARHRFPWGSDMPHFHKVHLREKKEAAGSGRHYNSSRYGNPRDKIRAQEPCRLYNVDRCNFSNCKFQHVCSVQGCGQAHPQTQHPKNH